MHFYYITFKTTLPYKYTFLTILCKDFQYLENFCLVFAHMSGGQGAIVRGEMTTQPCSKMK